MSKWVKKWQIDGSKGKVWTVSIDRKGNYGCSCPVWKFKRIQCHHIEAVKNGASKLRSAMVGRAVIVDISVRTNARYDIETNTLYLPEHLPSPQLEDIARIAKLMLENGYTMEEFRERYRLSDVWTATYLFRLIKLPENLVTK